MTRHRIIYPKGGTVQVQEGYGKQVAGNENLKSINYNRI